MESEFKRLLEAARVTPILDKYNSYLCNQPIVTATDVYFLDKGAESFHPCEEHGLHMYSERALNQHFASAKKELASKLFEISATTILGAEEKRELLNLLSISTSNFQNDFYAKREVVELYRKERLLELRRVKERRIQVRLEKEAENRKALLIFKPEQLPQSLIIEYYQCGRKVSHPNIEEARVHASQEKGLNAYKCFHCANWHVGHGGGNLNKEILWKRGMGHYRKHPLKANQYVMNFIING